MNKNGLLIFCVILLFFSCDTNSNRTLANNVEDQQLRSSILTDITDSIIIPSYDNLLFELNNLQLSYTIFEQNPNADNFNDLKNNWKESYIAWQYVEMFNIGKAEELYYYQKMNTYPVNTTIINQNIVSEIINISSNNFSNFTAQGFPALDYMLYGLDSDTSLIIDYYTGSFSEEYLQYLQVIINELVNNTVIIIADWQTNRNNFINSNGNTATSSLNLLINDFIFYYEKGFRANKIGIPAGVYSNTSLPNNVESFYNKNISRDLTLHALNAIDNMFQGKSFLGSNNISSLEDYINNFQGVQLCNEIIDKFNNAKIIISSLDNNYINQIQNNNYLMLQAFDAIQEAVPLLKIDMLALININIDYIDADGD